MSELALLLKTAVSRGPANDWECIARRLRDNGVEIDAVRDEHRAARRFEAAKAALTGLIAYSPAAGGVQVTPATAALVAVEYADALLAALDGTEGT